MKIIIITILLFLSNTMFSQDLDDFFVETNGQIFDIDSDSNYVYFGGKFTEVLKYSGSGVIFSTNSTKIDYNNKYKIYGTVNDAVPDGNGGWYICGDFKRIGESLVGGIAHINQDGSLDENFKVNIITQSSNYTKINFDDKFIYVMDDIRLYKYNFKTSDFSRVKFSERINDFTLDDNYIYISSEVQLMENYQYKSSIYSTKRLFKHNEEVDSSFQIEPFNYGYLNNPRIIKLHNNYLYSLYDLSTVSRINVNSGKIDNNWQLYIEGSRISINDIKFDSDNIFIAGEFDKINNQEVKNLAKINLNSQNVDINFKINDLSNVKSFDLDNDNVFVILNRIEQRLIKINKYTSEVDSNFNYLNMENYSGEFNIISLSNDKLFLGGNFSTFNEGYSFTNLFRFDIKENKVDTNFNLNINYYDAVEKIKLTENYLFLQGKFYDRSKEFDTRYLIVKNDLKNNELDYLLKIDFQPNINSIEIGEEYIYIGGDFKINNEIKNLFRFNYQNNEIDLNWSPNPNGIVEALKVDGDNLYVGGKFDLIYNQSKVYLAKLNLLNSTLDNDFDLGFIYNKKYKTVKYENYGVNLIEIKDDLIYLNVQSETKENVKISGLVEINNNNLSKRYLNNSIPAMNIVDLVIKDDICFAVDYVYLYNYLIYERIFKIDLKKFEVDKKWYCEINKEGVYPPNVNFAGDYLYYSTSGMISNYKRNNLIRFNDKDISLEKPVLKFPENNSINNYAPTPLITNPVKNSTNYYTVFSLENEFKYPNHAYSNIEGISFARISSPSTIVYWKTQVSNEFTTSEWSDVFSFKTRFSAPKILNSLNEDTLYLNYSDDLIKWENLGNDFKYYITADIDTENTARIIDSISVDENNYSANIFKDSTNYHFKVYAYESDSISEASSIYLKALYKTFPSSPIKIFPEKSQSLSKQNLKLFWKNTRDVDYNHLQVSKDEIFNDLIVDEVNLPFEKIYGPDIVETASYDLPNLDSNTTYFWRVKGINKLGESDFGETWSFTTDEKFLNLDNPKFNSFSIFPNPTNTIINIVSNNENIFDKVEIYNLEGILLLEKKGKFDNLSFDVSNFSKGTYILKIYSNNEVITDKFIKN